MDTKKIFLLPSELCFSKESAEISTLLGSCVAVCIFNKKQAAGGMNHFMLDRTPRNQVPSAKYGDYATESLIKMMLACDSQAANTTASVIGGGNVIGHLNIGNGLGERNIVIAQEVLKKYSIKVVRQDAGGDCGRKVFFKTWNGELEVRMIEKSQSLLLEGKAKDYHSRKIRVLVVDDSKTVRSVIVQAISEDPQIEVVGEAEDPYEARQLLLERDPDVICLDIIMPKMDGITFLKKLFLYQPKPVIIISTIVQKDSKIRQQAEKIGAVDVIDKASLDLYSRPDVVKNILTSKIKSASVVFVKKKTEKELEAI